jgi:16S rRNA U1498 N3-methylase RsmE
VAKGAVAVSLGRRTLRSETAAVAAAAVLQDLLEAG